MSNEDNSKRNLPSWMSSSGSKDKSTLGKKPDDDDDSLSFKNLLEGVVFVLSGFVNPDRGALRSKAQEMGAEYQPDWNSNNSTLLISAFPNTPKFRQVQADSGTIVSKEWILECYNQKKLVPIETYLMNAGKPWRKSGISHEVSHDDKHNQPGKSHKQVERAPPTNPSVSSSSKGGGPTHIKECFSPTEVKKWALIDLDETVSWLQSQEESPEPIEVKKIAAEGILTCLQDAIECLEKNQDIREAIEQWKLIPRVVKELGKVEDLRSSKKSVGKKDIYEQALACKRIYETEFDSLEEDSTVKKRRPKAGKGHKDSRKTETESTDAMYDSDETIEMTEDEIDLAYESISSELCK